MHELAKTDNIRFHFVDGTVEATAAIGVSGQHGGPFYRFFDRGALELTRATALAKTLSQQATTPEDFSRRLQDNAMRDVRCSTGCDLLQEYVEQHNADPFDGILGFSEGASLAASLLFRQAADKRLKAFKFAIFICGFPPFPWDSHGMMLADETPQRLGIPTAHIVGSKDPWNLLSKALYNLCQESNTSLFDHRGAHTIPWDYAATQGIAKEIRLVVKKSQSAQPAWKIKTSFRLGSNI